LGIHDGHCEKARIDAIIIGGVQDHVHVLLLLTPTIPLAQGIQFLKGSSSKWLNENGEPFAWQELWRIQRERIAD
jgi:REP element-mobilizing transposase RayT